MSMNTRERAISTAAQVIYKRLRNGNLAHVDWADLTEQHQAKLVAAAGAAYDAIMATHYGEQR